MSNQTIEIQGLRFRAVDNGDGTFSIAVSGGGGGSGVTSFNSRTGAVLPTTNDYNFNQLTGSASVAQLPTAIPIANVGSAGLSGTAPITISAAGVIACSTCVTSAASLTNNGIVIGAGTQGAQTLAGFTISGTGELDIGIAGTVGGVLGFFGATSGKATITAPPVGGTVGSAFVFSNNITVPSGSSTGIWGAQNSLYGNTITKYNNISTVSNGVPSIYGAVDLTAQTAAKAATTLFTPGGNMMVRVSVYLKVTTAASVSSVLGGATGVKITFTDATDSVAQSVTMLLQTEAGVTGINNAGNTTTTVLSGSLIIWAKSAVAVQYAIDYTSSGTAMAYEAHLKSETL